jgi:hypothetical protein
MGIGKILNLVERTNLVSFVGRVRNAMGEVKDFHDLMAQGARLKMISSFCV